MNRLVTTTNLEMTSRSQLRPAARAKTALTLARAEVPCPEFNHLSVELRRLRDFGVCDGADHRFASFAELADWLRAVP